ncbi:MAG TPA: YfhD family protein [Paenibacillus sp.]|uniref:YfhD family protein n=1 Tax=Paenibacillus sp. TaxID=58172 RepID=UPI0028D2177D|nr:YfhD family protein [Paenibacillus sp.]HUC93214.1 YfhD family protein [Paenibacillus sp.]
MNKRNRPDDRPARGRLPIGTNEDVEFSEELADEDDREARRRAEAADCRAGLDG